MSNLIKKFNVTINGGNTATYEVGADAKNVQFSDEATSPFTNETVEDNVPVGIVEKAENRIYGNAYIKNNDTNIEGRPEDFGPVDDIQTDRTNEGAGALTITYGFNSLAKGHHSTAIGFDCEAAGWASHAEGWKTATAQNTNYSHAEGAKTEANHNAAHAEGDAAKAYGYGSHAEGRGTYVYGVGSHAEGMASNIGYADKVAWQNSNVLHGFDMTNDASNNDVDVELKNPKQIKNGQLSHAEGLDNTIYGACCHAEGMYNTIHSVYASTAMGEANSIYSSASVAMGYKNTLNSGSNNSLILGNNNVNPGYPNALFLGQYCSMGSAEGEAPALVIGSGDENTPSNLMTIRHPQTGVASPTNRGNIWGSHINAHFGQVSGSFCYKNGDVTQEKYEVPMERPLIRYAAKAFRFDTHEQYPTYWAHLKIKNTDHIKYDPTMFTEGVKWRFAGGYISYTYQYQSSTPIEEGCISINHILLVNKNDLYFRVADVDNWFINTWNNYNSKFSNVETVILGYTYE